jgi:hypothetical protein
MGAQKLIRNLPKRPKDKAKIVAMKSAADDAAAKPQASS